MNKLKSNQLENYEVEVVEDIPEQFDLSRYKKSKIPQQTQQQQMPYRAAPPPPTSVQQVFANNNQPPGYYTPNSMPTSAHPQFENVYIVSQNNRDYLVKNNRQPPDMIEIQKNQAPVGNSQPANKMIPGPGPVLAQPQPQTQPHMIKSSNQTDMLASAPQYVQYVNYGANARPTAQSYRYPTNQVMQLIPQQPQTQQSPQSQPVSGQQSQQRGSQMQSSNGLGQSNANPHVQVAYYPAKDYDLMASQYPGAIKKKSTSSPQSDHHNQAWVNR
jgi:hypothetical protein